MSFETQLSSLSFIGDLLQPLLVWVRRTQPERGGIIPREAFSGMAAAFANTIVECIIVDEKGRILLHLRKGQFDQKDGFWNGWHTPGGWVFPGESMHAACLRHAKSLGVDVEVAKEVGYNGLIGWREDLNHPYGWAPKDAEGNSNGHLVHHYFVCKAIGPVSQSDELEWFTKEGAATLNMLRGHEAHTAAYFAMK